MENFALNVLKINFFAAICIIMILFAASLLKNTYSSHWKYRMWLLITIFLFLPFNAFAKTAVFNFEILQQDGAAVAATGTVLNDGSPVKEPASYTGGNPEMPKESAKETGSTFAVHRAAYSLDFTGLLRIFCFVWLAGFAVLAVFKLLFYRISVSRLLRWGIPEKEQRILNLYDTVCTEKGIKCPPRLMVNGTLESPLLSGLKNTFLYLPDNTYTETELRLIFYHELSHYMHRDLWYKMLLLTVNTVYWFNPALYLMTKEAEKDIEYICDSKVISKCTRSDCFVYQKLLLKTAGGTRPGRNYLSASLNDGASDFKKRILSMIKSASLKKGNVLVILLSAALLASNVLIGCAVNVTGRSLDMAINMGNSTEKKEGIKEKETTGTAAPESQLQESESPASTESKLQELESSESTESNIPVTEPDQVFASNRVGLYFNGSDPTVIVEVTSIHQGTITFNLRDYDNKGADNYADRTYTELNQVTGTLIDANTVSYKDSQYDFTMSWVIPENTGLDLAGSIYFDGTWPAQSSITKESGCYNQEDSKKLHTS